MHIAARARRLASEQDIGGVKRDVGCSSTALGRVSVSSPIRRNRDGSRYPVKNPLICRRKRGRPTCPAALPPVHLGRNDEMRKLIAGAIELHLSGMREDGGSRRLTARNSDRRLASGSADEPTRLGSRVVDCLAASRSVLAQSSIEPLIWRDGQVWASTRLRKWPFCSIRMWRGKQISIFDGASRKPPETS
jgi:hypothetical protein